MLEIWIANGVDEKTKACDFKVVKEKVRIDSHGLRPALFWNFITLGNCYTYRVYAAAKQSEIIHESYVIHRCYKFPFLKANDIEIGPCFTVEKCRGRGIYPMVLQYILQNEIGTQDKAYMIVDDTNIASIKGVEKAGFRRITDIYKTRYAKIYKYKR